MKTKLSFLFLAASLNFFSFYSVKASHLVGGSITYHYLGNSQYRIVATIYRDCAGIALAAPQLIVTSSCTTMVTLPMTLFAGPVDVNPPCSTSAPTTCHGGTAPGIQRYDFSATITLAPCADWKFAFNVAARNAAITNLSGAGSQNMYLETMLNNAFVDHDSPTFNAEPQLMICDSVNNYIDCSADGWADSITYSLACPKNAANTCVTYAIGYDSIHFIAGTSSLDTITGLVTINPTGSQVAVFDVLVKQYRGGVVIGSMMRDLQVYARTCSAFSHQPLLSGIDSTNQYSITVPANRPVCFNVFSSDTDTTQATHIFWNSGIANASFTVDTTLRNQSGRFCWTPLQSDTGTILHCFNVEVMNGTCPYPGFRNYNFCITVVDSGYCNVVLIPTVTNDTCPGSNQASINVVPSNGTPPFIYSWNNSATGSLLTGLSEGAYHVLVTDSNGCIGGGTFRVHTIFPWCNRNLITGVVFWDINYNGIQDAGEPGLNNIKIISTGSVHIYATQTFSSGTFYSYPEDTGTIITRDSIGGYYNSVPVQHASNFASNYYNTDTVDFAIQAIPGIQDLRITLVPQTRLILGRDVGYTINYSNVGTDTMTGIIYMIKDYRLLYVSSTPAEISVIADSVTWNYSNLLPNETRTIHAILHVPLTAHAGDHLSTSATIEPVATDSVPADNQACTCSQIIWSSCDPNNKDMLGGDVINTQQISNGEYLTYVIHFQNTGNDTAYDVIIKDTIDNKMDGGSFEMVSSSHTCMASVDDNKYMRFAFNNILLPDSNVNELASHGYVSYRIKPKSSLVGGDIIRNTASIFFDFNAPVVTNTTITSVEIATAATSLSAAIKGYSLIPNPTNGNVTLSFMLPSQGETNLVIYNELGEKMEEASYGVLAAGRQAINLDVKNLDKGIYFLKVIVKNHSELLKMVKM